MKKITKSEDRKSQKTPVRRYTKKELKEFFDLDNKETKKFKNKGFL